MVAVDLPQFRYLPVNRKLIQLGFYLTSIGSHHYAPNTPYPAAGHPTAYRFDWNKGRILHDYALILITAGSGEFETEKVPLTCVKPGQAIYLVPGDWHRYRPQMATGWTERWICLNGFHLHQLRKAAIIGKSSLLLEPADLKTITSSLERLFLDVSATPAVNKFAWSARALEILLHGFEATHNRAKVRLHKRGLDPLVNQAFSLIHENCHRPLTVDSVAAHCRTIRRTLERHFKSNGLSSVAQEIAECRLERAESLLKESQLPVKEIAFACGFATAQRMIYSFHQHRGYTPGSLRAS